MDYFFLKYEIGKEVPCFCTFFLCHTALFTLLFSSFGEKDVFSRDNGKLCLPEFNLKWKKK